MGFLPIPEPDPVFLAFVTVKKFVFLEILVFLALTRTILGRGSARWPALVALLICLGGIATTFAPALNMASGQIYALAARLMNMGEGMTVIMLASSFMLLSAIMPNPRWRFIDGLNLLMIIGIWGFRWWVS